MPSPFSRLVSVFGLLLFVVPISTTYIPALASPHGAEHAMLLAQLRSARDAGDAERLRDLMAHYEKEHPSGRVTLPSATGTTPVIEARVSTDKAAPLDRWQGNDVLVAGTFNADINPSLACDASGVYYAAVEEWGSPCEASIYRSTDGGESWSHWVTYSSGSDMRSLSLYAADGNLRKLLMAYVLGDHLVCVMSIDMLDPLQYVNQVILENSYAVSNPRVMADSDEFPDWFGYLVFNAQSIDNWQLLFSRSVNMGVTWSAPVILGDYSGIPNPYYDAAYARPDVDCGSGQLCVAYDNYPSPGTEAQRDVFLIRSDDYGVNWDVSTTVASDPEDEFDPSVAVARSLSSPEATTVVAYTKTYDDYYETIDCVEYGYTNDGWASWTLDEPLACYSDAQCGGVDLAASSAAGRIHAAFTLGYGQYVFIYYTSAPYTDLAGLSYTAFPISWEGFVDPVSYRASVALNRTLSADQEAGVAWTDIRNDAEGYYQDVYFDGGATVGVGNVVIEVSPPGFPAPWTLYMPDFGSIEGAGDTTMVAVPDGIYTIYWWQSGDWIPVNPSPEEQNLFEGETITFSGRYENIYPQLTSLTDVPGDQGRQLRLSWTRSAYDNPGSTVEITGYSVYRRQDRGESIQRERPDRVEGWDWLTWMPAYGDEIYQYVAPTLCDSTEDGGVCWSAFFIRASTPDHFTYYDSPPDSGYSIDNLAPGPPENLRWDGPALLAWDESADEDFGYFTVYGSEIDSLDGSAEVIGHTSETGMDVSGETYSYFHVTATDLNGNEGGSSSIESVLVTPEVFIPSVYALRASSPNPFNTVTIVSFDLPDAVTVRLLVFDISGRRVKTLVDGLRSPGRYDLTWTADDDRGRRVAPGVYFARLEGGGFVATRRLVVVE